MRESEDHTHSWLDQATRGAVLAKASAVGRRRDAEASAASMVKGESRSGWWSLRGARRLEGGR